MGAHWIIQHYHDSNDDGDGDDGDYDGDEGDGDDGDGDGGDAQCKVTRKGGKW